MMNGTDPTHSPHSADRRYPLYVAMIAALVAIQKIFVAASLKGSSLFSDDYGYINKSIYFIRGDFRMSGYPFQNVFSGVLYPIVLAPWQLFDDPAIRILVIHVINIMLAAITTWFAAMIVHRLSGVRSWLAPWAMALLTPVYLFSFHALTENLLFCLLALCLWFVLDFERTLRSPWRLAAFLAILAALPISRPPGMAVLPAILVLLLVRRRQFGGVRSLLCAGAVMAAMVLPYLFVYSLYSPTNSRLGVRREDTYIRAIDDIVRNWDTIRAAIKLTVSQLGYIFLATAAVVLPALAAMVPQVRRMAPDRARVRWSNALLFISVTTAGLMGMTLLHLMRKIKFDPHQGGFVYGRYDDPMLLLLTIGGVAAVLALRASREATVLLKVAAPLLLVFAVDKFNGAKSFSTINQSGMAFFSGGEFTGATLLVGFLAVVLLLQLRPGRRAFARVYMVLLITFWAASNYAGLTNYIRPRVDRISKSFEAAEWLYRHSDPSDRIAYDRRVFRQPSPTWRGMGIHYQALYFAIYPRSAAIVGADEELDKCDYLFTSANRSPTPSLPEAWTNGYFSLYRVAPGARVFSGATPESLENPASNDIQNEDADRRSAIKPGDWKIEMRSLAELCCPESLDLSAFEAAPEKVLGDRELKFAWKQSRAVSPGLLLRSGTYRVTIRARAEGCDDDPPQMALRIIGRAESRISAVPGPRRCYSLAFFMAEEGSAQLELEFLNDGPCGARESRHDKNIFVDEIRIEYIGSDRHESVDQ